MRVAVITGASRGIGLATAQKFLKEGWSVIGTYGNTAIPFTHPHLHAVHYDQANPRSIKALSAYVQERTLRVDALINNAGVALDVFDTTPDLAKVRKTFEVNLFGVIELTESLLPHFETTAHIINVDSQYGSFSMPIDDETSVGYRMAKAALNMYTRSLAFRLKDTKIMVSSLDPGWVNTDMGNAGATGTEKPNREPHEPAQEIYDLATSEVPSGQFWKFGKQREW